MLAQRSDSIMFSVLCANLALSSKALSLRPVAAGNLKSTSDLRKSGLQISPPAHVEKLAMTLTGFAPFPACIGGERDSLALILNQLRLARLNQAPQPQRLLCGGIGIGDSHGYGNHSTFGLPGQLER